MSFFEWISRLGAVAVAVVSVFTAANVSAAPPTVLHSTNWKTAEGLPQNSVTSLIQTKDGYLWIGTFGGLARFDGVSFTNFNPRAVPEMSSSRFLALYEDDDGTLWTAAENGEILRRRDDRFTRFDRVADGASVSNIAIFRDREGFLWISGSKESVIRYRLDGEGFAVRDEIRLPANKGTYSVLGFAEDASGAIWMAAYDRVVRFRGGEITQFDLGSDFAFIRGLRFEPSDVYISGIASDAKGAIWVSTLNGPARFDGQKFVRDAPADAPDAVGSSFFFRNREREIVAFHDGRIIRRDDSGWQIIGRVDAPKPEIRAYVRDSEGNFWLGNLGHGLTRLQIAAAEHFGESRGVPRNEARAILEDRDGNLWAASYGLLRFNGERFETVREPVGGNGYSALAELRDGTILAGTWNGLVSHKNGVFRDLSDDFRGLMGSDPLSVAAIHEDRAGSLWIGLTGGLGVIRRLPNGRMSRFTSRDGLGNSSIQTIYEDRAGNIWFGTFGGVTRFADETFVNFTTVHGLTDNNVRAIFEDDRGSLWIGTYGGGLNRFRDGAFTSVTSAQGLFDDVVSRIIPDRRGNIWMLGNRGIFAAKLEDLDSVASGESKNVVCRAYAAGAGIVVAEGNGGTSPAGWLLRDESLWFPMVDGFVHLTPSAGSDFSPPTYVEQVSVDGRAVSATGELRLGPSDRNIEIKYTALGFSKPEQIRFRYRLRGLSDDWNDAGTRRTAYFSYIPPGTYQFEVTAANPDGVWSSESRVFTINVEPPFYRTWWFSVLAAIVILAVAFSVYLRRVSRLEAARVKQEEFSRRLIDLQEAERKRIAGELHDSLSQNLVVIRNRALLTLTDRDDRENAFEQLEEIAEAATHSLSEVREIAHNLRPFQIDRLGLSKTIEGLARKTSTPDLEVVAEIDNIDGRFSNEQEINIFRIVQECLNNILKHSGARRARISIEDRDDTVLLAVSDDGRGFDTSRQSVQNAENKSGFGLVNIEERARILGAAPIFETAPGRGTTIRIEIRSPRQI